MINVQLLLQALNARSVESIDTRASRISQHLRLLRAEIENQHKSLAAILTTGFQTVTATIEKGLRANGYVFIDAGGAGGVKGMIVMLLKKIFDICNQVVGWWTGSQEVNEKEEEDSDMK
ncbi:hypothetical protein TRV_05494 [Trichophyton verrucosum HKI 0517]|uniref:Uncharacterized protein n=1 Tax=Trichophyton verrucosum (strain HKI 0517) TaxID=663202 RepID=D4DEC7_TRIVH|nr:uncharacterized protein TRV_05494 [Trichophyton verrucosum HKI 0517]EFE39758.1 hypothetical protein TRV_05494 [Trichophyton verrucosum HKI 0517]